MSLPLRVVLVSLLLSVAATATRAAPPRPSRSFDEAGAGWFQASGMAALGGYGRFTEDRERAAELLKRIDGGRLVLVPVWLGEKLAMGVVADLKTDPADTAVCTRAAVVTAMNAWRYLASREVENVPVVVRLHCRFIDVEATFRDPARPRPEGGFDLLSVVQTVTESGAVHLEWHAPFTLLPSAVSRESGARGLDLLYGLVADQRYRDAAKALGDRVEPTISTELASLGSAAAIRVVAEPTLHPGVDLVGGGTFPAPSPRLCLSASVHAFLRTVTDHARHNLGRDGRISYRRDFTCNDGSRARIVREAPSEAEAWLALPGEAALTRVGVFPVAFAPIDIPGTRHGEWFDETRAARTKPSPRTAAGRLAWLEDRLVTVARLAGADDAELEGLVGFGLELVLGGTLEALGTGRTRMRCDATERGASRACRAEPPIDLPQASCIAVAWALAAGLPHVPKSPIEARDDVRVEVACGTDLGEDLSVTAHRRADGARGLAITLEASGRAERAGSEETCEDVGFGVERVPGDKPAAAVAPQRLELFAPIDPAAIKPLKPIAKAAPPAGARPRAGARQPAR